MTSRPEQFDEMARAAHADALDHVSARVQAQLQQRRRAALTARAPASRHMLWPMLALSGTAAVVLAIGLRFARDPVDAPTSPPQTIVATMPNDDRAGDTVPAVTTEAIAGSETRAERRADAPATTNPTTGTIIANTPTTDTTDATLAEVDTLLADMIADDENDADTALLAANDDALLTDLEENPDLYLWLGSDESLAEITEVL
jgi:hypothetical protein